MHGTTEFAGGVFSAAISGGRASATIELTASAVIARVSDGQAFAIAYSDCQLDIGGASGRMVFCRTADRQLTIFCEERPFPAALELESGGELAEQLLTVRRQRRAESFRWRMWLCVGSAVTVLVLIGSYYLLLAVAKSSVRAVPVSVDQKIGKLAMETLSFDGAAVNDPVIVGAVKEIVKQLEPHSELKGLKFEVRVIDSSDVNAFCLPGGQIVVFTGLLKKAHSPEQVAGVLSHEMAHAIRRHGLQRVTESLGVVVAVELMIGDVGGLVALGVELAKTAALTSYSREAEAEADAVGVKMLHAAAIDPLELAAFFELLKKEDGNLPDAIAWISTHPQHDVRIAAIRGQLEKLGPREYRALEIDWEDVQQHLRQLRGE